MNYIIAEWPAPAHIKAYTTTRRGWGQLAIPRLPGVYQPELLQSASSTLKSMLALPSTPIWVNQTHSTIAIPAIPDNTNQIADATYTTEANRVCAVLTSDCLPILICNQQGSHVAAIHAGWRGLASGIISATLASLQQNAADLLVWLGPAIGQQKYEVGHEVYMAFTQAYAHAAMAFLPHTEGKWLADLYALARIQLQAQGVTHVYGGQFCTYSQNDLFFSYRRDKIITGSMASLIWIEKH